MDYSEDYRDTWQEAGFGGTWHKKWQWNLGIHWQF